MDKIAKKVLFEDFQICKGNRNKKIISNFFNDLRKIKKCEEEDAFERGFNILFSNKNFRESYLLNNLFPDNENLIATCAEIGFTQTVKYELRWQFILLGKFCKEISDFLAIKRQIEEDILEEKYEEALVLLSDIKKHFGVSFWYIENYILINKKLNSEFSINELTNNQLVNTIASFYDMKAANEVSSRDYSYYTRREIAKFKRINPDINEVINFYHYMIAPFSFDMNEDSILYVLTYMHRMPIIDRYLFLIDVTEYFFSRGLESVYGIKVSAQYKGCLT